MDAAQLREAAAAAPVAVVQNHYSLLERGAEAEVLPAVRGARRRLRAVLPARERPAHRASTAAASRRRRARGSTGQAIDDETFDRIEALERFAAERGHTLLELAIGALASRPAIVVR